MKRSSNSFRIGALLFRKICYIILIFSDCSASVDDLNIQNDRLPEQISISKGDQNGSSNKEQETDRVGR